MEKETPNENSTPLTAASLSKKHILGIENMPIPEINALLERANYFADQPKETFSTILANYTVLNIFFENSRCDIKNRASRDFYIMLWHYARQRGGHNSTI